MRFHGVRRSGTECLIWDTECPNLDSPRNPSPRGVARPATRHAGHLQEQPAEPEAPPPQEARRGDGGAQGLSRCRAPVHGVRPRLNEGRPRCRGHCPGGDRQAAFGASPSSGTFGRRGAGADDKIAGSFLAGQGAQDAVAPAHHHHGEAMAPPPRGSPTGERLAGAAAAAWRAATRRAVSRSGLPHRPLRDPRPALLPVVRVAATGASRPSRRRGSRGRRGHYRVRAQPCLPVAAP